MLCTVTSTLTVNSAVILLALLITTRKLYLQPTGSVRRTSIWNEQLGLYYYIFSRDCFSSIFHASTLLPTWMVDTNPGRFYDISCLQSVLMCRTCYGHWVIMSSFQYHRVWSVSEWRWWVSGVWGWCTGQLCKSLTRPRCSQIESNLSLTHYTIGGALISQHSVDTRVINYNNHNHWHYSSYMNIVLFGVHDVHTATLGKTCWWTQH